MTDTSENGLELPPQVVETEDKENQQAVGDSKKKKQKKKTKSANAKGQQPAAAKAEDPVAQDPIKALLTSKIANLEGGKIKHQTSFDPKSVDVASEMASTKAKALEQMEGMDAEAKCAYVMELLLATTKKSALAAAECDFTQSRCRVLQGEKQTISSQLSRTTVLKDKLESLCRQLQTRNKAVNEELTVLGASQKRQQAELSKKFTSISDQINAQEEARVLTAQESAGLQEKIQKLLQYEQVKEEHYQHQLKTKEIEKKLLEAKLEQATQLTACSTQEGQAMKEELLIMQANEKKLRGQLADYSTKFSDVEDTLSKSNELFRTFKTEMDRMSKQMKKMEKDKLDSEKRSNKCQMQLIKMLEESKADKLAIDKLQRQKDQLASLCKLMEASKKKQAASAVQ